MLSQAKTYAEDDEGDDEDRTTDEETEEEEATTTDGEKTADEKTKEEVVTTTEEDGEDDLSETTDKDDDVEDEMRDYINQLKSATIASSSVPEQFQFAVSAPPSSLVPQLRRATRTAFIENRIP